MSLIILLPSLFLHAAAQSCRNGDSLQACGGNRVIEENKLPGAPSTEWDINGAGDPSIQGFAADISVNAGDTIAFKVRTPALSYRMDIYRMGWYNGHGARHITTAHPLPTVSLPQEQPECYFEAETLLVDCGNWHTSMEWSVPTDAVSGIYFGRLVRTDDEQEPINWRLDKSPVLADPKFARLGWDYRFQPKSGMQTHGYGAGGVGQTRFELKEARASHIYFVIRDDTHTAAILVQTMDTTWQAYNCWGTTNTYAVPCDNTVLHAGSPAPPNKTWRAYKASYNRPFATRAYRAANMPFNAEYPLVRWLERNGYDVAYWTGVDADRFGSRLALKNETPGLQLYISVAHDEYWSGAQRYWVEAARDRGVNLAFFSGNEAYWRIRWEVEKVNSGELKTFQSHRTLVVYKETQSPVKIDPVLNEWTGTFRDGREINPLGAHPENALTGTAFTVNAWRNDFLEVPARFSAHRFWRNTSVASQQDGETFVVPVVGLLGHEWDSDVDNGFRPKGINRLSETTVDNVQHLFDEGAAFDARTATHHLTLYRHHGSGSLVFGAGTCQWSWGLDGHHDLVGGQDLQMGKNVYSIRVSVDQLVRDGNRDIQQATMNLFADMGILPNTPQAELTATSTSKEEVAKAIDLWNVL